MGSAEWGSDSASFASTPRCRSRPPASASVAPPKPSSRTIGRPLARLPRVAAHETTPPPPFASHWPERSRSSAPPLLRRCGASRPSTPITRPGRSTSWRPSSAKKASVGMTPAMVEVALGKPTEVESRVGKVGPAEGVDRPEIVCGFARPAAPHRAFRPGRRGQHRHAWPPGQFHHAHQRGRSGNRFPPRPRPARRVVTRASRATTAAPSMVQSAAAVPFHRADLRRDEKNPRFMA